MAFCPVCGEEAVDVFCEEHLREQEPLIEEVKPFKLVICSTCDRFLDRGSWHDFKRFESVVKRAISYNRKARIEEVHFPLPVFTDKPEDFELPVAVTGSVSERVAPYTEEYVFEVPVSVDQCDRCSQAKSGYFEGVLQLRNPRDEVVEHIEREVAGSDEATISAARDVNGGIDFDFTNQQFMAAFVHDLQERFGGEVRKSSKLHTYDHQSSKKVYRLSVLLRLPKFWVGDVIETRKRLVRVKKMGSVMRGFDLRHRKSTAFPCPRDDEAVVHTTEKAVVSSVRPRVMILDPFDYQEVALAHEASVSPGQQLRVVRDERGRWYVANPVGGE